MIHGFWVTPRSWEHWVARYEGRGHRVLAPAYPGFEVEVEALNADPTPIEQVTVPQIVEHLESIVSALDSPAILIGHSAGGVFTQVLLDHGFGAAGVSIELGSVPSVGVDAHRRVDAFELEFDVAMQALPGHAREPEQPTWQVVPGSAVVRPASQLSVQLARQLHPRARGTPPVPRRPLPRRRGHA